MPMMNSEARKRAVERALEADPRAEAHRLADAWDREADHEDACGNGFAAVILHAHARELRAALDEPLSA
ncbi:hypothetical protein [Nocardioides nitrophenolicus]|uniref:hypothetical protein n=1 Tax=Nocardioides nitrophenolicus TaxID=60489 RepID=UPI00195BE19A|nr:hypothetical protein [Nocardioides nitrophenolicus]MBM7520238.1 hypothetical protein [Nocardioides nitrophenolicus]